MPFADFVRGVLCAGGYILQAWGLEYTTASRGAFTGTFTVLAVPMLVGLSGRSVPWSTWTAAAVALTGANCRSLYHRQAAICITQATMALLEQMPLSNGCSMQIPLTGACIIATKVLRHVDGRKRQEGGSEPAVLAYLPVLICLRSMRIERDWRKQAWAC